MAEAADAAERPPSIASSKSHVPGGLLDLLDRAPTPPPEIDMKMPANHLDIGTILASLAEIEELRLCYQVRKCGTEFRWNMFGMTSKDSDMLAAGLKTCKKLKKICIRNSQMDDNNFYALYDGLRHISRLEEMSLPNNMLSDDSAQSLVRVLSVNPIKMLDLTNNKIGCEGAKIIGKYLAQGNVGGGGGGAGAGGPSQTGKCRLRRLILALNLVGKEGCENLCQGLETNKTLTHLDMSTNELDVASCKAIARMLQANTTLRSLNLACNNFGVDGCRAILSGLERNDSLLRMDVRLTGGEKATDGAIQSKLRRNRARHRLSLSTSGADGGETADALTGLLMVPGADFDFGSAASAITFLAALSYGGASLGGGTAATTSASESSADETSTTTSSATASKAAGRVRRVRHKKTAAAAAAAAAAVVTAASESRS